MKSDPCRFGERASPVPLDCRASWGFGLPAGFGCYYRSACRLSCRAGLHRGV